MLRITTTTATSSCNLNWLSCGGSGVGNKVRLAYQNEKYSPRSYRDAAAGAVAATSAAASAVSSAACIYYVIIGGRFAPPYKYMIKYMQQKKQQKQQQQLQQQLQQQHLCQFHFNFDLILL